MARDGRRREPAIPPGSDQGEEDDIRKLPSYTVACTDETVLALRKRDPVTQ